jgi:hypothetical protein
VSRDPDLHDWILNAWGSGRQGLPYSWTCSRCGARDYSADVDIVPPPSMRIGDVRATCSEYAVREVMET